MVIGANIGTTVTSALASMGATANARRLAAMHAGANMVTAAVALLLLPPLWWLSEALLPGPGQGNLSTALALFHTLFNVLGLGLMVVLADPMLRLVERWIRRPELISSRPRYLDDTALSVPATGLAAMRSELKRVFKQLLTRCRRLIDPLTPPPDEDIHTEPLLQAIAQFGARLGAQSLSPEAADDYLNLNRAREELLGLRQQLQVLQSVPEAQLSETLPDGLRETLLVLTLSGELKQLDANGRDKLRRKVRRLRRRRRKELLQAIRSGQQTAEQASQQLSWAAALETAALHILHTTDTLYPPTESASIAPAASDEHSGSAISHSAAER
jgi:phosphate:Na+ symporter